MKGSTLILAFLVALSFLGGGVWHAEAAHCRHATAFSHAVPTQHNMPSTTDPMACNGLACPMIGCCFARPAAAEFVVPAAVFSAIPLRLVIDGSGTEPVAMEHPPKIS